MQIPAGIDYFDIMAMAKKSYGKLLAPICTRYNLTRNALDVLLFLYNNPRFDRAADVVAHRGMAKSHVSLSVSDLESRRMLLRRFDEADRRAAHLVLTGEGAAIAREAKAAQVEFFSSIYRDVTPEEFALWGQIMEKVSGNIRNLDKTLTID